MALQAGDRIVCLRNALRHGVVNGTRATITRTDPARRTVEAVDDRDEVASLTSRLRRTRAEQPITSELAELAAEWRELRAQLDQVDLPRLQQIRRHLTGLEARRESLAGTVMQLPDHRELRRMLERREALDAPLRHAASTRVRASGQCLRRTSSTRSDRHRPTPGR